MVHTRLPVSFISSEGHTAGSMTLVPVVGARTFGEDDLWGSLLALAASIASMKVQPMWESFWSRGSSAPWIAVAVLATAAGFVFLVFGIARDTPAVDCPVSLTKVGRIDTVSTDYATVALTPVGASKVNSYAGGNVGSALKSLGPGDFICFSASGDPNQTQHLDAIAVERITIGWAHAVAALALAFAAVWWVILAVSRGHPWGFVLGLDGRLSNSQTQLYLWFLVLLTVYLAEVGLRLRFAGVLSGIAVPTNLLALAGISAFTFGTARLNTTVKTNSTNAASLSGCKTPEIRHLGRRDLFFNLFTNDNGLADLGDMQMIILSAITGALYLGISTSFLASVSLVGHVDLPPVDDTLLGGTAVSQGAYLFKKLASRPGLG